MHLPLDRQSAVPLYRQIAASLEQAILSGNLAPNVRLPATRQLARDLGVNRMTVETAYDELEAEGLVYSQIGSGTYVQAPLTPPSSHAAAGVAWPLWQQQLQAARGSLVAASPEAMLEAAGHPHPISFAGGSSDPRLFPVDDFRKVIQAVIRRDGLGALDYGEPAGYAPLRGMIVQLLASQGLPARPENILITSGSQQALALVAQVLLEPGDTVLVESPTYGMALELFRSLRLKIVGVPVDDHGMQVARLEDLLQQGVLSRHGGRLIYTIPNFQNPTGACLSGQRRRQLVSLADRYNVPILEDDYVGDLRYDGRAQPALKSLDPGGRVVYVGTFSKMLMPGLRAGFLVAEGPVLAALLGSKRCHDLASSNLHQRALEAYVTVGRYQAHLRRSCRLYRQRRDAMARAIRRYLPDGVQATLPLGGFFTWLTLPAPLSAGALLPMACREGVAYAPGNAFFASPGENCSGEGHPAQGEPHMRLNFACQAPGDIEEGIRRLAKAIEGYPAGLISHPRRRS